MDIRLSCCCLLAASLASSLAYASEFEGSSVGIWNKPIVVKLQIENGKITDIQTTQSETPAIGGTAINKLSQEIIKAQSLNVDNVSGATISSKAFKQAVAQAAEKADFVSKSIDKKKPVLYTDTQTDVVVVGGGPGGMMAAIELSDGGKKVILLEQLGVLGGDGPFISTAYQAAGSKIQKKAGNTATQEDFANFLSTDKGTSKEMAQIVAKESSRVIDFLVDHGAEISKTTNKFWHLPKNGSSPGEAVTPIFIKEVLARPIDVRLNNQAEDLIVENGQVVGVKVKPANGNPYIIRAKDVILATGGFAASKELIKKYAPDLASLGTTNSHGSSGSGHIMAAKAGASLTDMTKVVINPTTYNTGASHVSFTPLRYKAIIVSKEGVRIAKSNERDKNKLMEVMMQSSGGSGQAFLILDQKSVDDLKIIKEYVEKGFVIQSPTLEGLAKKLGINANNLAETVKLYQHNAKEGKDPQFGQTAFGTYLDHPPFYGCAVVPAVHATKGGISINKNGEVLNRKGAVIPGLFAVGQTANTGLGSGNIGAHAASSMALRAADYILGRLE